MTTLRPADDLLLSAVASTIEALDLTDADVGAVKLACEYATHIDLGCGNSDVLEKLGPKLLACLESLGATPLARSRIKKGVTDDGKPNQLQLLRDARRR